MKIEELKIGQICRFVTHRGDTFFKILEILADTVVVMMVSKRMGRADVEILDLTYCDYVQAMIPATDAETEEITAMLRTAKYHSFGEWYMIKAESE